MRNSLFYIAHYIRHSNTRTNPLSTARITLAAKFIVGRTLYDTRSASYTSRLLRSVYDSTEPISGIPIICRAPGASSYARAGKTERGLRRRSLYARIICQYRRTSRLDKAGAVHSQKARPTAEEVNLGNRSRAD